MQLFYLLVSATLTFNALLIGVLAWAYYSPRFADNRISMAVSMRETWQKRLRVMSVTSALSLAAVFGGSYLLFPRLVVVESEVSVWRVLGEAALVLLAYDFTYYFLHRAMHLKRIMRWVHSVHHRARNPSALESFYLDPVELFAGLGLMFACTMLVGPVNVWSFGLVFFVYSTLNILVHSGLEFRLGMLRPIDFLAKKHHVHHKGDFAKNFSSLTPLPDLLFRTAG